MTQYDYAQAEETAKDREPTGLEFLDKEIEYLAETAKKLESRLGPVLNQYGTTDTRGVSPEPSSALRGRAVRIGDIRGALADLIDRVDL